MFNSTNNNIFVSLFNQLNFKIMPLSTVKFAAYEESYQFKVEEIENFDITTIKENVKRVLVAQFRYRSYRENGESLWCDVKIDGKQHGRYSLNFVTLELDFFICWKHGFLNGENGWFPKTSRVISETATHFTVIYNEKTMQTSEVCKSLLV